MRHLQLVRSVAQDTAIEESLSAEGDSLNSPVEPTYEPDVDFLEYLWEEEHYERFYQYA